MRRQLAVAGPVLPPIAWDRYARLDDWPTWAPFILGVDADGPVLAAGLTGVVRGPVGIRIAFTVDEVDDADPAARSWRWTVRSGPLVLRLGHEVLARRTGGTVATLDLDGPAPVVLGYLAPATLALRRLVAP